MPSQHRKSFVLQTALVELRKAGFDTALGIEPNRAGWRLRWWRNDAKWWTTAIELDALGKKVLGWLDARERKTGNERLFASQEDNGK